MKNLFYTFYALLFNLSRILFPLKKKRVAFVSMHNENFCDSLGAVFEKLKEKEGYNFVFITREDLSFKNPLRLFSFFFLKSRLLATSEYVFLNDNFLPMGKLNFSKDTVITQLWHGEGAFKKFGLHIPQNASLRKAEIAANGKLTYVVCSGEKLKKIYSEAFGIDESRVLPLGSPRTDFFEKQENLEKARAVFFEKYPFAKGKKILLYAPTFRGEAQRDSEILRRFDAEKIKAELKDEYEIFTRLHPQIHPERRQLEHATDLTDYPDVRELILVADVLVTDYSSICMDFCYLGKKTVFYCYDLEWYTENRNFYFDYKTFLPGEIAKSTDQLIEAVKSDFPKEKTERFRQFNFSFFDGKSTERVLEAVLKK